jgi:nucleoside-diphosphate-sugar epimerase
VAPHEWCIVRRILDSRRRIVVSDGGTQMESRLYTEDAARAVLLAVDYRAIASGRKYVAADDQVFTMSQRIEFVLPESFRPLQRREIPQYTAASHGRAWRAPARRSPQETAAASAMDTSAALHRAPKTTLVSVNFVSGPPVGVTPLGKRGGDVVDAAAHVCVAAGRPVRNDCRERDVVRVMSAPRD